ncbi:MAG: Na+/H+ antiporter subunit E [Candidatus Aenigmatarchaeota archaeon]|nr:MAG: Na+/H+ antiporter subunit E [Candidatus Aenigmarchaeota archaeon]RLJ07671.1 MAG: Na+/H+ antiporter subunit E [Candidatus Aenigmarchaeota archaeon]RLJ08245.1 MAG: Na+/H+ antiporter subunit E [Candidatus Aenigmarchaeota archaeon]
MKKFVFTFFVVYIVWLFLIYEPDLQEMVIGVFVSMVVTFVTREFFTEERHKMIFNPMNWARFFIYLLVFLYVEILSHLSVAKSVITGNIKPAIIKIPTRFKTDLGKTLLANSITLTPGTLTLHIDDLLYIHTLVYNEKHKTGELFEKYGTGVTE